MSDQHLDSARTSHTENGRIAVKGLTGLLAVFVAIQAMAYSSSAGSAVLYEDHILRLLAFCSLTLWLAFALGLEKRGMAAIMALGFASLVDLLIVPARAEPMGTLVSANLGIVLAYCGLHLYWNRRQSESDGAQAS